MLLALPLAYFALACLSLALWHQEVILWNTMIHESARAAILVLIFLGLAGLMVLAAFVALVVWDRTIDYALQGVERDGMFSKGGNWNQQPDLLVATLLGEYDPSNISLPEYKLTKLFRGRVSGATKSSFRNRLRILPEKPIRIALLLNSKSNKIE